VRGEAAHRPGGSQFNEAILIANMPFAGAVWEKCCVGSAFCLKTSGVNLPKPTILGLNKSFGFGDRLGLATPGHVAAIAKTNFVPIFAQQSVREMERTQRTPVDVMEAAQKALCKLGWTAPWGADADHHKTEADVKKTAVAGFTFFTIDPSAFVVNDADRMSEGELSAAVQQQYHDGVWDSVAWEEQYLEKDFDVGLMPLRFSREQLRRAAVKYARAIHHAAKVARAIQEACVARAFEIEVSVDETDSVTSPLDHLFVGLELKRRKVPNVVSVAPRFIGEFEKGIDYRGDFKQFERQLREHVAVAQFCGPYKISIHSGSDKFSIYPIIGRVCGDLLHLKTAGTSYLEALRVVARTAPELFAEICSFCRGRFDADRKSYHISATQAEIDALRPFSRGAADEALYLDDRVGRQLLHVTFGSVLTQGVDSKGRPFKGGILDALHQHPDLHLEFLEKHFDKHLSGLMKG
jgi:tagaturonate epimerase